MNSNLINITNSNSIENNPMEIIIKIQESLASLYLFINIIRIYIVHKKKTHMIKHKDSQVYKN